MSTLTLVLLAVFAALIAGAIVFLLARAVLKQHAGDGAGDDEAGAPEGHFPFGPLQRSPFAR